jgi:hypothetical protein
MFLQKNDVATSTSLEKRFSLLFEHKQQQQQQGTLLVIKQQQRQIDRLIELK